MIRLVAISSANISVISSSYLLIRNAYGKEALFGKHIARDRFLLIALFLTGICLVLSLENIQKYHKASELMRSYVVGVFISMLIGWLFVAIVVVPIRMWSLIDGNQANSLKSVLTYLKQNRISVLLGFAVLLLGWPIFFIYLFLALGLAQAFQITNFPLPEESSERYFREKRNGLD